MNQAIESFYYIMNKFFVFIFGAYIFDGVSIGMIMVCTIIFSILFTYLLGVPKIRVSKVNTSKGSDRSENT